VYVPPPVQETCELAASSVVQEHFAEFGELATQAAVPHLVVLMDIACVCEWRLSPIVNDAVPLPLAVPEIAPVELSSDAHDGSDPAVTRYVSPAQAPVAVAPEKGCPATAIGSALVRHPCAGRNDAIDATARRSLDPVQDHRGLTAAPDTATLYAIAHPVYFPAGARTWVTIVNPESMDTVAAASSRPAIVTIKSPACGVMLPGCMDVRPYAPPPFEPFWATNVATPENTAAHTAIALPVAVESNV
jgi:hypothetical protein